MEGLPQLLLQTYMKIYPAITLDFTEGNGAYSP